MLQLKDGECLNGLKKKINKTCVQVAYKTLTSDLETHTDQK